MCYTADMKHSHALYMRESIAYATAHALVAANRSSYSYCYNDALKCSRRFNITLRANADIAFVNALLTLASHSTVSYIGTRAYNVRAFFTL